MDKITEKKSFKVRKRQFHSFVKKAIASIDEENTQIDIEYQRQITMIFIALHMAAFVQSVGFFIQNTSEPANVRVHYFI